MDRSSIKWKTISELCKPHLILMNIREQSCHATDMTETKECNGYSTHQPENRSDLKDVQSKGLKKLFSKLRSRIHRTDSEVAQYGSDCQKANVDDLADRYKVLGSLVNFSRNPSLCETYETRRSQMTEVISSPTWLVERSHYSPCSGPVSIQSEGAFCARPSALQSPSTAATTDNFEDILKDFGLKRHKTCVNRPNTLRLQRRPTRIRPNMLLNETSTKIDFKTPVESREEDLTIQIESKEHGNPNNNQNKWKTLTEMKLLRAKDDALSDHVSLSPAGRTNWEENQAKMVTIFTRTAKRRIKYGRKEVSNPLWGLAITVHFVF
ncbi:hypothetical protein ACJMK2_001726 [Sinanodonta woodiana]|uniref:Uncharacterized protein n=1 Tax=Sinanodonta woodiana TaxID=1069815 RepID=A0ABD3XT34_SINWO